MKKVVLIAMLFSLAACEAEPASVVRVCVNYGTVDSYCGTGFFSKTDTLITAKHITDKARDGKLTVVTKGVNPTSRNIRPLPGYDAVMVTFGSDIAEDVCPICSAIYVDTEATIVKADRFFQLQERYGHIDVIENEVILKTDIPAGKGFSGGPLIDDKRNCVVGVVVGVGPDSLARASILTTRILEDDK